MKTDELKTLINAAESLGHKNIELVINHSRDGVSSMPLARAELIQTGSQMDPCVTLVFSLEP
ncbi:MAG: hypothetical protein COB36_10715 [Alphaproteobacteria bacterium]|nr:MAG: hypothetical protein COB36_10715 [Alphaproteobacteria bacterium]